MGPIMKVLDEVRGLMWRLVKLAVPTFIVLFILDIFVGKFDLLSKFYEYTELTPVLALVGFLFALAVWDKKAQ